MNTGTLSTVGLIVWLTAGFAGWVVLAMLGALALARVIKRTNEQPDLPREGQGHGVSRGYAAAHPEGPEEFDG